MQVMAAGHLDQALPACNSSQQISTHTWREDPCLFDLLLGKFLQNVPDQCTRDLLNIDEYHVIIHTAVLFGLLNQSESDVFHGTT